MTLPAGVLADCPDAGYSAAARRVAASISRLFSTIERWLTLLNPCLLKVSPEDGVLFEEHAVLDLQRASLRAEAAAAARGRSPARWARTTSASALRPRCRCGYCRLISARRVVFGSCASWTSSNGG